MCNNEYQQLINKAQLIINPDTLDETVSSKSHDHKFKLSNKSTQIQM